MINKNDINNLEELFTEVVSYAFENEIKKIIIFAKGKENVLKLREKIGEKDIELLVTTFPMNQVLYLENDEGDIEEYYSELFNEDERELLENEGIKLISSTLPFDPIIIPGHDENPYNVIKRTLNLFGEGMDLIIQSALMTTDNGATEPEERVISMNTKIFVDMLTTNSRYLFHPTKKVVINSINE